ncbi:hypothetical protein LBMAG48_21450 [Phycisphaerae bacterium]|nr:hypothetical protein LBMAG48_21450 [Phycisphaerae bacterium]
MRVASRLVVLACVGFSTPVVLAQRLVTFDSLALGAAPAGTGVTFQLFSPPAGSGIAWPVGGAGGYTGGGAVTVAATSTGTRAVQTPLAGPGFSPEGIRMLFAVDQPRVKFTVGVGEVSVLNAMYRVTGYNGAGTAVFTRDYPVGNSSSLNCNTLVDIDLSGGTSRMRRIDVVSLIQSSGVNGEYREVIDSLEYFADVTPPQLVLNSPANDTCVSPVSVPIVGFSQDLDGTYTREVWEFSASADGPWTNIATFTSGFGAPGGTLTTWNTSTLASGWYFVRGTATNADQLVTTVHRRLFVDNVPPVVVLRSPVASELVGGTVCFDGSVSDNGCTFGGYSLAYRAVGGGAFTTIVNSPTAVTNDPLGTWNTRSPLLSDGNYEVRVTATDGFGSTAQLIRNVTIDNTAPTAVMTNVVACEGLGAEGPVVIRGTVNDANISGWALQYTTGNSTGWTTIATGTTNVSNGVLGVWNVSTLPACAATLRLTATDRSNVNCGSGANQSENYISVRIKRPGSCSDIDFNNNGVFPEDQDVVDFFNVLAGGACGG